MKNLKMKFTARVILNVEWTKTPVDLTGVERLSWKLSAQDNFVRVILPPIEGKTDPAQPILGALRYLESKDAFDAMLPGIRSKCPMKLSVKQGVTKSNGETLEPVYVELDLSTGSLASAIVGARFRGPEASRTVMKLKTSDAFSLEREPTNKFDHNAVLVKQGKLELGYIPKTESAFVSYLMDILKVTPLVQLVIAGASPSIRLVWGKM